MSNKPVTRIQGMPCKSARVDAGKRLEGGIQKSDLKLWTEGVKR